MSDERDPDREPMDRDLREYFARLRIELTGQAPDFASTWRRARSPQRARFTLPLLAGAGAAAAAAALLLLRPPAPAPTSPTMAVPPSLGAWRAPTDFLLLTPGRELLSRLPGLGLDRPPLERPSATPERSVRS